MTDDLSPFGLAAIVASLAFLAAGIVLPEAAEALLRLLLLTLGVGFVAARVYEARLPERMSQHVFSPFEDHTNPRDTGAPAVVLDLAAELGDADHGWRARRAPIPRKVRWRLIDEASRRLSHHHGLRLDHPDHRPAIRSLVSGPTWSLLEPEAGLPPGGTAEASRRVPMSRLHSIIDDLERL